MFTVPRPGMPGRHATPEVPPSTAELGAPIRFLDLSVELANLLREIVGLLLELRHLERRDPFDLAYAVAVRLFLRAGDRRRVERVLRDEHVAMCDRFGERSPVAELRLQVGAVD